MAVVMFAGSLMSVSPSTETYTIIDDPSYNYDDCINQYNVRRFFASFYGFSEAEAHEIAGNQYETCVDGVDLSAAMYYSNNP